jgi:hypothetical protein
MCLGAHIYHFEVKKGRTMTRMGGAGWRRFIQENDLNDGSELICSSCREPMWGITVIYVGGGEED